MEGKHQIVPQQAQHQWVSSYLIGRFHTTKQLDPHMLKQAIQSQLKKLHGGLDISLIGNNLYVLHFERVEDQKQILEDQPWEICGHLFILKELNPSQNPRYIELTHVPIWFYFNGLYVEHYDGRVIKRIAKALGTVLSIDPTEGLPSFAKGYRVRVDVPVLLPLPRGTLVRTVRDGVVWVSIVPERLPSAFCKKCLLLGHQEFECKTIYYQVPLPPPLQQYYCSRTTKAQFGHYMSFYSSPDPRIVICSRSRKGKRALIDPFLNAGGEEKKQKCVVGDNFIQCESLIVEFIEGRGPPLREFSVEMVKQLYDYLSTQRGRRFLQERDLVFRPTTTKEFGVDHQSRTTLKRETMKLFSAARIDLSEFGFGNSLVNDQGHNMQCFIKKEAEEEVSQFPSDYSVDYGCESSSIH